MKIETIKIDDITPYENNPRDNTAAIDKVAVSIHKLGFRNPVILDKDKVIIAGHTRVLAAKRLGMTEVPCIIAADLSPEQAKALRIADNKTAEIAEWKEGLLTIELASLRDNGFDLSVLGFEPDELAALLDENKATEGQTDPDEAPETPDVPDSKPGTNYTLGRHVLRCGDATNPEDVAALMGDGKADLWLTDPPYNVAYEGGTGMRIENDDMEDKQFREFLRMAFLTVSDVLKPGSPFYIFHADSEGFNFRGACHDIGLRVRQCLIWRKNSLVLGRQDYLWIHEPCLYGWTDGAAHPWHSDRSQTTVMEFDKPHKNDVHPTMKPVAMLEYLIGNSSSHNALVIDTFGGSGSTLVACEKTGRTCRTMELDPKYCDVIRKRWAEFTHGEGCDWKALTPETGK